MSATGSAAASAAATAAKCSSITSSKKNVGWSHGQKQEQGKRKW